MWNVALEKKKIVWVVMSPILKKTSLREFMQLRQSIQKILYRVENLKNRKNKNVNKTGLKRKCMDREMPENVDKNKTWQWLSKCDLKIGTEALLCAAQEQAIRTNYVKHYIDNTSESPLCRLCGKKCESVQHLVCGCEKLALRACYH